MTLSDILKHLATVTTTANANRDFDIALLSQQAITAISELQYKCQHYGFCEENGDPERGDYATQSVTGGVE